MKVLLDTHLLLWAAADATELPRSARSIIEDSAYTLLFSVVSLWEIVIKRGLDRDDFQVDPHVLRRNCSTSATWNCRSRARTLAHSSSYRRSIATRSIAC